MNEMLENTKGLSETDNWSETDIAMENRTLTKGWFWLIFGV